MTTARLPDAPGADASHASQGVSAPLPFLPDPVTEK